MCRGVPAPAASEASATAHMLGGRTRLKPSGLKFNPLRKKPSNVPGLHVGASWAQSLVSHSVQLLGVFRMDCVCQPSLSLHRNFAQLCPQVDLAL